MNGDTATIGRMHHVEDFGVAGAENDLRLVVTAGRESEVGER